MLVPSTLFAGLFTLSIWMALSLHGGSLAGILVFAVLYGICSGAFVALLAPSIASISEVKEMGRRFGLVYSVLSFPCVSTSSPVLRMY